MSFYSDASLALIPSGYKNGKVYSALPTDGSGDLSFTRASNATRVASNGLIEKVRTNLLLQSNSFDTTWTNTTSTETSGQAGYDGTNNAWLLEKTNFSGRVQQFISASGVLTFSVYAKAGTDNFLFLRADGGAGLHTAFFDLVNGTVGITALATGTITAAGNGYYRCSISFNDTITIARIYVADANGDTSGTSGNIYIQDSQLEQTDFGPTPYIATTTTAVSVGPVSGLPRLDYLGCTCGKLLLEPQRTNSLLFSEQFDNAAWTKLGATITANNATSPDGYINADFFAETATLTNGNNRILRQDVSTTANVTYTYSIFIKKNGTRYISMNLSTTTYSGGCTANVDLDNPTSVVSAAYGTGATLGAASIVSYGNNWYRINLTATFSAATTLRCQLNISQDSNFTINYNGNVLNGVLLYGAQLEQGAYPSSYVNTLSTSVTRVADAASKTGISSLIGQTEGTLFVEFEYQPTSVSQSVAISDGTSSNRLDIRLATSNIPALVAVTGGVVQASISSAVTMNQGQRVKLAAAYKNNDFVLYQNGALVASATSGTIGGTLSRYGFDLNGGQFFNSPVNQALLFKTRLTNAQLAELTTL
jgi:hypothetical protein